MEDTTVIHGIHGITILITTTRIHNIIHLAGIHHILLGIHIIHLIIIMVIGVVIMVAIMITDMALGATGMDQAGLISHIIKAIITDTGKLSGQTGGENPDHS